MALTIGQVAKSTGVAARTIRFYEAAGVLAAPRRTGAGYRQYSEDGVQQLLFVRRARALGLSLRDLKTLLAALDGGVSGPVRPRVREVVRAHLSAVQAQIRELGQLERQLAHVLRRMRTRSGPRPGGRCRCLDLDDAARARGTPWRPTAIDRARRGGGESLACSPAPSSSTWGRACCGRRCRSTSGRSSPRTTGW